MLISCRPLGWLLAAGWLGLAGCSDGMPTFHRVVPVHGKVTHQGIPVDRAQLNFAPVNPGPDAVHATAQTGKDGTFQLSTYKQHDGARPGEYIVTVYWPDSRPGATKTKAAAGEELAPDRLRGAYSNPAKSPLRATVKEGDNDIVLELP